MPKTKDDEDYNVDEISLSTPPRKKEPDDGSIFIKDQSVAIPDHPLATVKEPIPNEDGEILVQIMKWVPIDQVKAKVIANAKNANLVHSGTSEMRISRRMKQRPPYFSEEATFFKNEPDGKYSSSKVKLEESKIRVSALLKSDKQGFGSLVTSAWSLDPVRGEFTTVHLSREARTRIRRSKLDTNYEFGKDDCKEKDVMRDIVKTGDSILWTKGGDKASKNASKNKSSAKGKRKAEVIYVEDDDDDDDKPLNSSDDDDKIPYNPPKRRGRKNIAATQLDIETPNTSSKKKSFAKPKAKVICVEDDDYDDDESLDSSDSSNDACKIPYTPSKRKGTPSKAEAKKSSDKRKADVNYAEDDDDDDSLDSSDDDCKIPYTPSKRKGTPSKVMAKRSSDKRKPDVNYAEVDDEIELLNSSDDDDKIPFTPPKRKGTPKEAPTQLAIANSTSKKEKKSDPCSLWDLLSVPKEPSIRKIKSMLPLDLQSGAEHLAEFLLFCHERQKIWTRRKQGVPMPWSKDTLLTTRHFTNIYRELDAGSVYLRRHILNLKKSTEKVVLEGTDSFATDVLWASICYRCLCRIETFEALGGIPTIPQWEEFRKGLSAMHKNGDKLFTAAYQVMGFKRYVECMNFLHGDNCDVLNRLSGMVINAGDEGNLEKCTKSIQNLPNVGEFYAWQVTCDLMESGVIKGCEEASSDWVQLGPGASNGLKYIFSKSFYSQNFLCKLIRDKQKDAFKALGVDFIRFDQRDMSLKVIEHALCEFYKYSNFGANKSSAMSARTYNGKGNGSIVPMDTNLCAGKYCVDSLLADESTATLCDTCWRYFCPECSLRVLDVDENISWVCKDCRNLSCKE